MSVGEWLAVIALVGGYVWRHDKLLREIRDEVRGQSKQLEEHAGLFRRFGQLFKKHGKRITRHDFQISEIQQRAGKPAS